MKDKKIVYGKTQAQINRMTDYDFTRFMWNIKKDAGYFGGQAIENCLIFSDIYEIEETRRLFRLKEKRRHILRKGKDAYYVITPHEHGNGGWCGHKINDVLSLDIALKTNPVKEYHYGYYDTICGSQIRLCRIDDPNFPVYVWDHEYQTGWKKIEPYKRGFI